MSPPTIDPGMILLPVFGLASAGGAGIGILLGVRGNRRLAKRIAENRKNRQGSDREHP
jgi:hypothetical protein